MKEFKIHSVETVSEVGQKLVAENRDSRKTENVIER